MKISNFEEARIVLREYVPPPLSSRQNYDLVQMRSLMRQLGNPQDSYKVIHVAGTSGKTSTSYYVTALLKESGKKVGLSVSPHIDQVNERVQLNLQPLPEAEFCQALTEFIEILNKLSIRPTYFELLVSFAYWYYEKVGVDYAVMEVGLGGLMDGTNVVTRTDKVCIITDIGKDHMNVLGRTLREIATQKAGIILRKNHVFTHLQGQEIMAVLNQISHEKSAALAVLELSQPDSASRELPQYQQRNWQLARRAYEYISRRDGLEQLTQKKELNAANSHIPARMEVLHIGDKTLIMDGAHNEQKMRALVESIRRKFPDSDIAVLLSLTSDKKVKSSSILRQLSGISAHVILTSFRAQQDVEKISTSLDSLRFTAESEGVTDLEVIEDSEEALNALLLRPEPVLLITGSFYLLSKLRKTVLKLAGNVV